MAWKAPACAMARLSRTTAQAAYCVFFSDRFLWPFFFPPPFFFSSFFSVAGEAGAGGGGSAGWGGGELGGGRGGDRWGRGGRFGIWSGSRHRLLRERHAGESEQQHAGQDIQCDPFRHEFP